MHRVLGVRDLVLLNIAAIVGLRWLSTAAQIGPSSLLLWVLALVIFFVPLALTVLELSSRLPGEGGLYLWSKAAFGDLHGFIAGWSYWTSNLVFFPSLLLFVSGVSVYIAGDRWLPLSSNAIYNAVFCLLALWGATMLNIVGLSRAKWLQNTGGMATWLVTALVVSSGGWAWYRFGTATAITPSNVLPHIGSVNELATLAIIAFAYSGLELGPILGGEIKEPRKTIPRAILIAGVMIAVIYIAGTAALLVALPTRQIDIIGGVPQALAAIGDRIGLPLFGPLTAGLLALSQLGTLGAWITGTARLPFVVGVDRYLPEPLAALHPKYGTPYVALLTQSTVVTIVLLAALSSATIHETYSILIDMTVILGLLPLLYIFASLPMLRRRNAVDSKCITVIPGGAVGCWLVSGLGFSTTLLAIVTSMLPPEHSGHPGLFFLKVVGGSCLIIAIGLMFYAHGRQAQSRDSALKLHHPRNQASDNVE
ncbi:MAG: APC family permease [Rhodanobacter sp.]